MRTLRIDHRLLVFIIAIALLLSSADRSCATFGPGEPNQAQLYFFTNEGCRPCKQVEPVLRGLADRGFPITKVDTTIYPNWVAKFRISSTPTIVLVQDNKEITRHSGFIDAATVESWFANAGVNRDAPPTAAIGLGAQDQDEFIKSINAKRNADKIDGDTSTLHNGTRNPANDIEELAINASVRLRVEDPEGISYATGTVIHCHKGEWLVLTCGHVFRDANGKGEITAEYDFSNDSPKTAPGRLISYESKARDIGLVAVQAGVDIQPIPVALKHESVKRGREVFTIGCDHGQLPTIRRSRIKNKAAYDGVTKYDIYGRPVDGRSGGGMFTADGELIGICNAASVDFDEGIYTALDTIYWQLAKVNLMYLFEGQSRSTLAGNTVTPKLKSTRDFGNQQVANTNPVPSDRVAVANHQDAARNPRNVRPQLGADRTDVNWQRPQESSPKNVPENAMEVILIVRSKQDPTRAEAITLDQPSPQLLKYLEKLGNRQTGKSRINMAHLRQQTGWDNQRIR